MTLRHGCIAPAAVSDADGGAIAIDGGALTLDRVTLEGNGAWAASSSAGYSAYGGALFAQGAGTVSITQSTLRDNEAHGGDAPAGGAGFGVGGAIYQFQGSLGVDQSIFQNNAAVGGAATVTTASAADAFGGALALFSVSVDPFDRVVVRGNRAESSSGAGTGANGNGGGAYLASCTVQQITASAFVDNLARGGDTSTDQPFSGGGYASGGGLYLDGGTLAALEATTFAGNAAVAGADAGSQTGNEGGRAYGGAARLDGLVGLVADLTVAGNQALGGASDLGKGGLAQGGGLIAGSVTSFADDTVSGNAVAGGAGATAQGSVLGGGVLFDGAGAASARGNVLAGNTATPGGGVTSAADCANPSAGSVASGGYNFVEAPGDCVFAATGDATGVDPQLGPLADNGCAALLPDGSCVQTLAPGSASPVLDAGSCTGAPATDGRGLSRPQDLATTDADDGCDAGAYELALADAALAIAESADPVTAGSGTGNLVYVVTLSNAGGAELTGAEVGIALDLPAGTTVASLDPGTGSWDAGTSTWGVHSVPAGGQAQLTLTLTVGADTLGGADAVGCAATLDALDQPQGITSNDAATEATTVISSAIFSDGFESAGFGAWSTTVP